jgi:hypothetical protein
VDENKLGRGRRTQAADEEWDAEPRSSRDYPVAMSDCEEGECHNGCCGCRKRWSVEVQLVRRRHSCEVNWVYRVLWTNRYGRPVFS